MKLFPKLVALALLVTSAAFATAQRGHAGGRNTSAGAAANSQALVAFQKDLEAAIQSMTSALPIYDGNRVKSIHAAHKALVIADHALAGANAAVRQKPTVTDHVKSTKAKSKYSASQISASQNAMEQGLAALTQASKDLSAAAGSNPNKAAIAANKHLQTAISEANKAISIHASGTAGAVNSHP